MFKFKKSLNIFFTFFISLFCLFNLVNIDNLYSLEKEPKTEQKELFDDFNFDFDFEEKSDDSNEDKDFSFNDIASFFGFGDDDSKEKSSFEKPFFAFDVPIPFIDFGGESSVKVTYDDGYVKEFKSSGFTPKFSIGVYKGDLYKVALWSIDLVMDKWLKDNLTKYYADYIFPKFLSDYENIISLLKDYNSAINEKDNKKIKETEKNINDFITKNHMLSYSKIFKDFFKRKLFLYLVYHELSTGTKEFFLGPRDQKEFLKVAFKDLKNGFLGKLLQQKPIPITSIIGAIPGFYSRPLTTGMTYMNHLVEELFRMAGWRHKIFDAKATFIVKEYLMLVVAVKRLDKILYQPTWLKLFKENREELLVYLEKYKELKSEKIKVNREELMGVEKSIKNFIKKNHDIRFRDWLGLKNIIFAGSELDVKFLFNLPCYAYAAYDIIKKYRAGQFDIIKRLAKTPEGCFTFWGIGCVAFYILLANMAFSADY